MVDVLPEWTVRRVKSSECVERKDGSESQTDVQSQTERKQTSLNATQTQTDALDYKCTTLTTTHYNNKTIRLVSSK